MIREMPIGGIYEQVGTEENKKTLENPEILFYGKNYEYYKNRFELFGYAISRTLEYNSETKKDEFVQYLFSTNSGKKEPFFLEKEVIDGNGKFNSKIVNERFFKRILEDKEKFTRMIEGKERNFYLDDKGELQLTDI